MANTVDINDDWVKLISCLIVFPKTRKISRINPSDLWLKYLS